ncbi:MAG: hypothetical protein ACJ72N_06995 [Labedaea sp.]
MIQQNAVIAMADLRDSLLRAIQAEMDSGRGLALVAAGSPWKCCWDATERGPAACICWQPVYDREQTTPTAETVAALALGEARPDVRDRMCGDCAYRPGSPEKSGSEDVDGDAQQLERLAATGTRFFCHDGMRKPVAWRHPAGMRITAVSDGDYQPPIIDNVPYRADGQPGLLCAGWDARRRALTAKEPTR